MKRVCRPSALALASALLFSTVGCVSSIERATSYHDAVSEGMSMDEIRTQLGDPDCIVRGDAGQGEAWIYRYDDGVNVFCVILTVIFIAALVVVIVAASKGGGSFGGGGWGGGGGDDAIYQFKVRFDNAGRVVELSPVQPVLPPQ